MTIVAYRGLPEIEADPVPEGTRCLARGVDTWVETWDATIHETIYEQLDAAQAAARAAGAGDDGRALIDLGGADPFEVQPFGGGGAKWIIRNPFLTVEFRSPKMGWATTIRISAAALWQFGLEAMQSEIDAFMARIADLGNADPRIMVSRMDYAFDFEAPAFTAEMTPEIISRFVLPTTTKGHQFFERSAEATCVETVTLGKLPGMQVTIYNKAKEIEHSKKNWMRDIWKSESPDIWRLEIRFGSDYLKKRGLRSRDLVKGHRGKMVAGGLTDRRLTSKANASTRLRRSNMHYLWGLALEQFKNPEATIAVAPFSTLSRVELKALLAKQMAGLGRTYSILADGAYDDEIFDKLRDRAKEIVASDKNHGKKIQAGLDKYTFIDRSV